MFEKEMDNEMDNAMGDLIIQLAADRPLKPIHQRITGRRHTLRLDYHTVMPQRTSFLFHLLYPSLAKNAPTAIYHRRENTHASLAPYPTRLNLLLLLLLGLWGRGNVVLLRLGRGVTTADLLPRRGGIVKVSKRLGELKGFVDDPLLFVVVSDLGVTLWGRSVSGAWNR